MMNRVLGRLCSRAAVSRRRPRCGGCRRDGLVLRSLLRPRRTRRGDGRSRATRDVCDHLRGLRAVRRNVDPRDERWRGGGNRRCRPAERALRPDLHLRRAPLPRAPPAPAARVTTDRRRVVGARGARRPLRPPASPRRWTPAVRGLGLRHARRRARRRRPRRPEGARPRRCLPRALPRLARAAAACSAGGRGRARRGRDRARVDPGHAAGNADRRGRRRLPAWTRAAPVNDVWLVVVVVGVVTVAFKATVPLLFGGRELPDQVANVVELLAPVLLSALVVTQTVGGDNELVLDARLAGVGVGAVAVAARAPLPVVVVAAAAATALVRLLV